MSDLFWLADAQMARLDPTSRNPTANLALMSDATYLKAHRIATSMGLKKGDWTPDRPHQGRHEPLPGRSLRSNGPRGTKLHAICDNEGRPLNLFVTAGQVSDYIGAHHY